MTAQPLRLLLLLLAMSAAARAQLNAEIAEASTTIPTATEGAFNVTAEWKGDIAFTINETAVTASLVFRYEDPLIEDVVLTLNKSLILTGSGFANAITIHPSNPLNEPLVTASTAARLPNGKAVILFAGTGSTQTEYTEFALRTVELDDGGMSCSTTAVANEGTMSCWPNLDYRDERDDYKDKLEKWRIGGGVAIGVAGLQALLLLKIYASGGIGFMKMPDTA